MPDRRNSYRSTNLSSIYLGVTLLFIVVIIGVIGYRLIEGYTLIQALYMVIITMATVGFKEVQPLSTTGMIFTIMLIVFSFGIFAYVVTTVSRYVLDGGFRNYYIKRKLYRKLGHMEGHVIICGYGRNGKQSALELTKHNQTYVIIESNEEVIHHIQEDGISMYIHGDATHDEILERAGITKAKALLTTLPNDADNTFVVLTARTMNPTVSIISRASDDYSDVKILRAGANNVIMPDKIGGIQMAKLVTQPDVVEFIDNILLQDGKKVRLAEILGTDIAACFLERPIGDLQIRTNSGASIIGIKTEAGEYIFNPSPSTIVTCDDKLFVLGAPDEILRLQSAVTSDELD